MTTSATESKLRSLEEAAEKIGTTEKELRERWREAAREAALYARTRARARARRSEARGVNAKGTRLRRSG